MLTDDQKARITARYHEAGYHAARNSVSRNHRVEVQDFIRNELSGSPKHRAPVAPEDKAPVFRGVLSPGELVGSRQELPPQGEVKRYLLTCAQNNTTLNEEVWRNLLALKEHYGAELFVGRILYDRRVDRRNQKTWAADPHAEMFNDEVAYTPEIEPFVFDSPTELAPGLRWCGELNVHATAIQPLSGFEGYAKDGSIIVPHPRIAMKSLPRMGSRAEPRFGYTTGAVTAINYIPRKAGQKAAFAHCYGALLVEVNDAGEWWARQIQADGDGTLCDLNLMVKFGTVISPYQNVEAVTWGDVHVEVLDEKAANCAWGPGGVVDVLQPRVQVMHDVLDFRRRNHHDRGSPIGNFSKWAAGRESVRDEVKDVARFLVERSKQCPGVRRIVVVDSNHDRALSRWLDETDYRDDPVNAVFHLEMNLARYRAVESGYSVNPLEHACAHVVDCGLDTDRVRFMKPDESYVLHGIEHGMHGDRGIDGRRGGAAQYAMMESKVTVGHTHSASIHAGVFTVGTMSKLRLSYTKGPTTWSWSFCLLYQNGQRAILTIRDGRAWA